MEIKNRDCTHPDLIGLDYRTAYITITTNPDAPPFIKRVDFTDSNLEVVGYYLADVLKIYEEVTK